MTTYVITKKNTFDVDNEVYFAYSLQEALGYQAASLSSDPEAEWIIAIVLA